MNHDELVQQIFSRNIGLLTEAEQKKLLSSHVAVVGAGGVGGIHVLTLARLGVGGFSIADPDVFEPVNISRQYGASMATVGRNKAEVLAEMVKEINPAATTRVFSEGVDRDNVDSFLEGAHAFIDGIEFFEIDIRRLLFMKARALGIYGITSAPLGFGATLQLFSPAGMSFDDYFGITDEMEYMEKLASFAAGLAPNPYHLKYLDTSKISFKNRKGPAVSPSCTLAASLVAAEVVKILTGKMPVKPVPHYLQIDLLRGKFKRGYLAGGGRNPLQRIKKWVVLKKMKALEEP